MLLSTIVHVCSLYAKSISLLVIFVHVVLRLPAHEVTREREQQSVHRAPSDQDSKVETDARVQVKQNLTTPFDHVVKRPCVAEVVETRCCDYVSESVFAGFQDARTGFDVVERRGDIGDDPEDEP